MKMSKKVFVVELQLDRSHQPLDRLLYANQARLLMRRIVVFTILINTDTRLDVEMCHICVIVKISSVLEIMSSVQTHTVFLLVIYVMVKEIVLAVKTKLDVKNLHVQANTNA